MTSRTEYIARDALGEVRRQVANYKRFKDLTAEWVDLDIEHGRLKMRLARESSPGSQVLATRDVGSRSRAPSQDRESRARTRTLEFEVVRAMMLLMSPNGMDSDQIAARLDTCREIAIRWRKRFFTDRLAALEEGARPGHPRVFSP